MLIGGDAETPAAGTAILDDWMLVEGTAPIATSPSWSIHGFREKIKIGNKLNNLHKVLVTNAAFGGR